MQRVNLGELDTQDGVTYYWHDAPFTGTGYELRTDGTLWSEIEYVGGKQQGVARDWYPSGQLKSETEYYNSTPFGRDREWDQAGRLRREAYVEYGFQVSEKQWDETGRLIRDHAIQPEHPNYEILMNYRARYGANPRENRKDSGDDGRDS